MTTELKTIEQAACDLAAAGVYLAYWRAALAEEQAARERAAFGRAEPDAIAGWHAALAGFRQSGRSEVEAILLCARAHPDIYAACCVPKADMPPAESVPYSARETWDALIRERVAGGLSRVDAITAVMRERPDLVTALNR